MNLESKTLEAEGAKSKVAELKPVEPSAAELGAAELRSDAVGPGRPPCRDNMGERPQAPQTLERKTLAKKRVLITGANGGLGLQVATQCLAEGAEVVFACRTTSKAFQASARALEDASQLLRASTARISERSAIATGGFDMLDPEGIETAVAQLPETQLDVVFLQAGGWVWADAPQITTLRGVPVERSIAKNVVGAHATLRALMRSGRLAPNARIVIIGGEGARGAAGIKKPDFEDLADFQRYLEGDFGDRPYVPVNALGAAKLCAALWTRHLAANSKLDVLWFTPGLIAGTGGTAGMPAWKEALIQKFAFPILVAFGLAQRPPQAAAKCVDCLAGRIGKRGDLLGAPEGKAVGTLTEQTPMHPAFSNLEFQRALYAHCEAAAGALPTAPLASLTLEQAAQ